MKWNTSAEKFGVPNACSDGFRKTHQKFGDPNAIDVSIKIKINMELFSQFMHRVQIQQLFSFWRLSQTSLDMMNFRQGPMHRRNVVVKYENSINKIGKSHHLAQETELYTYSF